MSKTKNDVEKIIHDLEELASKVLKLKEQVIPRRPMLIELCGSPKSGKTSCINSLNLFLKRNKFRTKVLTERASVCPVENKYDPLFNIWTVTSVISEISELISNNPKDYDVIILDRGIFDALCWFTWLLEREHLDDQSYKAIVTFLTMKKWQSIMDIIYVFTASPEKSLEREFANLLTRKTGSIMHPDILQSYIESIDGTIDKFEDEFKKVQRIDTTDTELNDVNYKVTKNILDLLYDITSEKIGFIGIDEIDESLPVFFEISDTDLSTKQLNFDIRGEVEDSKNKLQILPILVITNKEKTKVLVVKKNNKTTQKDSPESNKLLMYLGGHVREEDWHESDEKNLIAVSRYALHREIKEETGLDYYPNNGEKPFCIWFRDSEKSKKHLAVCYVLERDIENLKIKLDGNEFIKAGNTKSGKFLPISELSAEFDNLEQWSQVILQKVFSHKVQKKLDLS